MARVLVIGGYGNAGAAICSLLLAHSPHEVVVAGRHAQRAEAFAADLAAGPAGSAGAPAGRVRTAVLDADDPASATDALARADLCVVAAGTSGTVAGLVAECLRVRCDVLDIQVSAAKAQRLLALDAQARAADVVVVTDGGFHPGLPAAMVRAADARLGPLQAARVASVIAIDWARLRPLADSTVAEMMEEFRDYRYEEYRDGRWVRARGQVRVDFPPPFGRRTAAAMGLAEMRQLTEALPHLRAAGFYVGGFNPVVDWAVIPLAMAGMRLAPQRLGEPLGRLLRRSLVAFSRPPYGTLLQLDGARAGEPLRPLLRVAHPDGYVVTAAPVVATVLQVLDGSARRPGAHTQAMLVEPERMLADLARCGVAVDWPGGAPDRPA